MKIKISVFFFSSSEIGTGRVNVTLLYLVISSYNALNVIFTFIISSRILFADEAVVVDMWAM